MKISTKLMIAFAMVIGLSATSFSQFAFTVSPGISMNAASFGYRFGNFVPYGGFQFVSTKLQYTRTGKEYDNDKGAIVNYEDKDEFSGGLYVPNLGLKYFIVEKNDLKAYFNLNLAKPMVAAKILFDGEEDDDFKEDVKQVNLWGGELGFGVEYFFNENFSLGGEFGLRYVRLKYEDTYETTIYNPNTSEYTESETTEKMSMTVNPTFSRIALNFYF